MGGMTPGPELPSVSGEKWPGVNYFCSTRQGGTSNGPWSSLNVGLHTGDDSSHVQANRDRLRRFLPSDPVWLNQVHGSEVHDTDRHPVAPASGPALVPTADAAITTQPGRVLAIMTADCLPVVLASADGRALGVAHAGWRGLAGGVLERTLGALRGRHAQATAWRAWIGPAIGPAHFEVGADVYAAFVDHDEHAAGFFAETVPGTKWLADLPSLARRRLQAAGVESIEVSGYCTYSQPELFYSYRRESRTGRLVTLAWLDQQSTL